MRKITALVDHQLTWVQQRGLRPDYELRFGDELVATLSFPKMLSSTAILKAGEGSWVIERMGFFDSRIVVRTLDSETEVGEFKGNAWKGGGTLELSGGQKLEVRTNMWKHIFQLVTDSGELMIETSGRGFFRYSVDVRMTRKAALWPELPWLVAALFYLMMMKRRESAAHAAAH